VESEREREMVRMATTAVTTKLPAINLAGGELTLMSTPTPPSHQAPPSARPPSHHPPTVKVHGDSKVGAKGELGELGGGGLDVSYG